MELSTAAIALATKIEDLQGVSNELEAWFGREFPGEDYSASLAALRAAGLIDAAVSWKPEERRGVRFSELSQLHLRPY